MQEYLQSENDDVGGGGSTRDNNNNNNFATAALKIQNSVGIYNRKVDFLHQVVYSVFHDFIQSTTASNNINGRKKRSSHGTARDIEEFHAFDTELEFLLLDDVLPLDRSVNRRRINLKELDEDVAGLNASQLDTTMAPGGNGTPTNNDVTLLSLGGVMSASRLDQNGTFMVSRESMQKASPSAMSRMLMANLQGGYNAGGGGGGVGEGNLRLVAGMCDVDARNGALLMPGTSASVFVNGEAAVGLSSGGGGGVEESQNEIQIFPEGLSPVHTNENGESEDFENASFGGGSGGGGGDVDFGGDDDGVGFELNDQYGGEEKKNDDDVPMAEPKEVKQTAPKKKKVEVDLWATLDPHVASKDRPQPLRIGVTFRLPPGLDEDDRPSAGVTGSRTRSKGKSIKSEPDLVDSDAADFRATPFLSDITLNETMREGNGNEYDGNEFNASMQQQQAESNIQLIKTLKSKELIFGEEFAYVAKAHAKHRDAIKRQRRMQQQQAGAVDTAENDGGYNNNYDDDDNEYGGGFDFGGDDDHSFGNNGGGGFGNDDSEQHTVPRSNVDFHAIDDVFGTAAFQDNDEDSDSDFANSNNTFEDLCRAHLRKFAKSAERYAAETQLTKRVGAWQSGLVPILEEQEQRPEFDIHSVGRKILQKVESSLTVKKRTSTGEKKLEKAGQNNVVPFHAVSKDSEDYEVCRQFLSTLMLCNCGNIVMHDGNDVSSVDSLRIELINTEFKAPMDDFLAESDESQLLEESQIEKENDASFDA